MVGERASKRYERRCSTYSEVNLLAERDFEAPFRAFVEVVCRGFSDWGLLWLLLEPEAREA